MTPAGSTCAFCGAVLPAHNRRGRPRKFCAAPACQSKGIRASAKRRRIEAGGRSVETVRAEAAAHYERVAAAVAELGSQVAAAQALGISRQAVNDVLMRARTAR